MPRSAVNPKANTPACTRRNSRRNPPNAERLAPTSISKVSCSALVLWEAQVRTESLRRLQLAAQAGDTMVWLVRPLAAA
jgi:hypothetical protein